MQLCVSSWTRWFFHSLTFSLSFSLLHSLSIFILWLRIFPCAEYVYSHINYIKNLFKYYFHFGNNDRKICCPQNNSQRILLSCTLCYTMFCTMLMSFGWETKTLPKLVDSTKKHKLSFVLFCSVLLPCHKLLYSKCTDKVSFYFFFNENQWEKKSCASWNGWKRYVYSHRHRLNRFLFPSKQHI